jgi:hypothetical protein
MVFAPGIRHRQRNPQPQFTSARHHGCQVPRRANSGPRLHMLRSNLILAQEDSTRLQTRLLGDGLVAAHARQGRTFVGCVRPMVRLRVNRATLDVSMVMNRRLLCALSLQRAGCRSGHRRESGIRYPSEIRYGLSIKLSNLLANAAFTLSPH